MSSEERANKSRMRFIYFCFNAETQEEIIMPVYYTRYKTSDGKEFEHKPDAEAWQRELDGDKGAWQRHLNNKARNPARESEQSLQQEAYNKIVSYYNAGNWDAVIETYDYTATNYSSYKNFFEAYPDASKMADDARKKAQQDWEKAHGHPMTESDKKNIEKDRNIKEAEEKMRYYIASDHFHVNTIVEWINRWQNLSGRKLTKEEQVRIFGNDFKEMKIQIKGDDGMYRWQTYSELIPSSCGGGKSGGSILFSIIGAIVVAIIGYSIINPHVVGLISGAIGGFFLGKWLSGKLIGKILLIVLLVLVGGTFIISKLPSTPAPAETTATEENQ
jgi:Skp family chaperone for outer membrane proteins